MPMSGHMFFGDEYYGYDDARLRRGGACCLIRASNTQPAPVLRAEAKDEAALARIKETIEEALRRFPRSPPRLVEPGLLGNGLVRLDRSPTAGDVREPLETTVKNIPKQVPALRVASFLLGAGFCT